MDAEAHRGFGTGEERDVRQLFEHGHDREAVRVATGELVSQGGKQLSGFRTNEKEGDGLCR